jgi:ABC-type glycerol-3-phosphate transport system substrate-binding protein
MDKPAEEDTNYTIVLVVPDNADMDVVNEAIRKFNQTYPDVKVEVKTGYGSPAPKETPQTPAENTQGN